MRLEKLLRTRGIQIAGLATAIVIAVLGNEVLSGFGPGSLRTETTAPADLEKAASALLGGNASDGMLDMLAEEMSSSSSSASSDELDWILDEIFVNPGAPREEACSCEADHEPSAGCLCCGHADRKSDE
jgi:hypothetical protein